ncbi:MAG: ATP-dependent Clp protease adaptor ClpS [Cytophagales bacterium]|nr:ATP-dependent Clp protease adaptor ClpS [Cytophagales bacterium]
MQEALSPEIQNTEEKHRLRKLVVFNDDINTFEHVIKTLMLICRHEPHQAEQCAYLIHHRGKCTVREGTYVQLLPMRKGIVNAGIFAEIL